LSDAIELSAREIIHVRSAVRIQRVSGELSLSDTEFRTWWEFTCGLDGHGVRLDPNAP
jgi:hypothetical protein